MTKKEFIEKYAEVIGEKSKKRAGELVEGFLATVEDALTANENVQFVGWGTFEVRETAERMGRNPKTGEEIKIPAKKAVKFKAGKNLAEKVNN
ncbi:MAG: HU family DNA-binding protein [Fusobacteria bacterium]|nr:HU family DNA-binding protein [Fusobacteriota bacterium]